MLKPPEQDGALTHGGQRAECGVLVVAIDQPVIDLVAEHEQVVPLSDFGDGLELRPVEHGAGRVVRVAEEDRLGAGRDGPLDHRGRDPEVGCAGGADGDGGAAGELDARGVRDEAGLVVDDLVAGIEGGAQAGVDTLGGADRDEQLGAGIVGDAVSVLEVGGDQLPELQHPAVGGVVRLPRLQAGDGGTGDRLRGREVGLTDGEADDVLHLGQHVEEAPDAGRRHGTHAVVQEVGGGSAGCRVARHSADSVPSPRGSQAARPLPVHEKGANQLTVATGMVGTMVAGT